MQTTSLSYGRVISRKNTGNPAPPRINLRVYKSKCNTARLEITSKCTEIQVKVLPPETNDILNITQPTNALIVCYLF